MNTFKIIISAFCLVLGIANTANASGLPDKVGGVSDGAVAIEVSTYTEEDRDKISEILRANNYDFKFDIVYKKEMMDQYVFTFEMQNAAFKIAAFLVNIVNQASFTQFRFADAKPLKNVTRHYVRVKSEMHLTVRQLLRAGLIPHSYNMDKRFSVAFVELGGTEKSKDAVKAKLAEVGIELVTEPVRRVLIEPVRRVVEPTRRLIKPIRSANATCAQMFAK